MDIKYRRILYTLSTLLFFAVIVPLIMYALGITYNGKKHKLEYDGGIYLKFEPKQAVVTIDGTPYNKQSPFELTTLSPGIHEIDVSAQGYRSWRKIVRVEPRQTVTFPLIVLFPIALPERVDSNLPIPNPSGAISNANIAPFTVEQSVHGLRVFSTNPQASTTIPLATSSLQFLIPGTQTALFFDEPSKRLALVNGSRASFSTQLFEHIESVVSEPPTTLFWTPFELWMIRDNSEHPELVTRVSEGISSALVLDEYYAAFTTKSGSVFVSELTSLFGRTIQHLATFSSIDSIASDGIKRLYIHGVLTETSEPGWFSLRLK